MSDALGAPAPAEQPFAGADWAAWDIKDDSRFNGQVLAPLSVRRDPDGQARLRMHAGHRHTNLSDNIHGGVILSLVDVALFAIAKVYGLGEVQMAVTLDVQLQFIGAGKPGKPLDAVGEVLKETGRLAFVRGLVVQDEATVAAFSGTIRKIAAR